MSVCLQKTTLRSVGLLQDTKVYELQSEQFVNRYFILSDEGTRRLMAFPEVVGFETYRCMLSPAVATLCWGVGQVIIRPSGKDR